MKAVRSARPSKVSKAKANSGKGRQDKYYYLAKEIGYRSRASFKLIQLNKKFGFLDRANVCLDLACAPGGWMQVAKQTMNPNSIVIGVDQDAVKPLDKCITIQEDMMSERCIKLIGNSLKNHKADVVMCDVAPHYGSDFKTEVINQNKLVLRALEIASRFLTHGGWFISKIARTEHFDSLIGVTSQFFKKVSVTKPEASKSESSESYVICKGYEPPKKLDKAAFDPEKIFNEISIAPQITSVKTLFGGNAKNYSLKLTHIPQKVSVKDFVLCQNFLDILAAAYEILFDDEEISSHPSVTPKIKEFCKDLKLLNRKSVRELLKWRNALHTEINNKIIEDMSKETQNIDKNSNVASDQKSDPKDNNDTVNDALAIIRKERKAQKKQEAKERKAKQKLGQTLTAAENVSELFSMNELERLRDEGVNLDDVEFDQDIANNIPDIPLNLGTIKEMSNKYSQASKAPKTWLESILAKNQINLENEEQFLEEIQDQESDSENFAQDDVKVKMPSDKKSEKTHKPTKSTLNIKDQYLSPKEMAIATAMLRSKKAKRDIEDASIGKYLNFDGTDELPKWFVDDEKKNYAPQEIDGVDNAEIDKIAKKRVKDSRINSRSLSKVAEYKARKRAKLMNKMKKTNVQAQAIMDEEFTPVQEKVKKMRDIYKKMTNSKEKKYIVTKKKHDGRKPRGSKAPYKMVDKRMKQDDWRSKKNSKKSKSRR